jgi:hypothetical protein
VRTLASASEVRVAVVPVLAPAHVSAAVVAGDVATGAVAAAARALRRVRGAGRVATVRGHSRQYHRSGRHRPLQHHRNRGSDDRGVAHRPVEHPGGNAVEPAPLGDAHGNGNLVVQLVAIVQALELHAVGWAADGDRRLAAADAGARCVTVAGACQHRARPVVADGAEGGAPGDDVVAGAIADQRHLDVAPGHHQLVSPLGDDVRAGDEAAPCAAAVHCHVLAYLVGQVHGAGGAQYARRGVGQRNLHDLEGAVAEQQPWRLARLVAGEGEAWVVAAGADAEWEWHADVPAAASAARRRPCSSSI